MTKVKQPCYVDNCDVQSDSLGLCQKHYCRQRKYGDYNYTKLYMGDGTSPEERFWSKVNKKDSNECWNWLVATSKSGYGASAYETKFQRAHRLAWYLSTREWPSGILRHTCDNRLCCNTNHLLDGTHAENEQDKIDRGRVLKGSKVATSKLTEEQVMEIKLRKSKGETSSVLASEYNVTPDHIRAIARGRSWKHLRIEE